MGIYDELESIYLKSLKIREEIFGIFHPNTANSYNNLALFYRDRGDYEQAEIFNIKALSILDDNELNTATSGMSPNPLTFSKKTKKLKKI
jgi:tetratricopeptide (TPR) repeat protein